MNENWSKNCEILSNNRDRAMLTINLLNLNHDTPIMVIASLIKKYGSWKVTRLEENKMAQKEKAQWWRYVQIQDTTQLNRSSGDGQFRFAVYTVNLPYTLLHYTCSTAVKPVSHPYFPYHATALNSSKKSRARNLMYHLLNVPCPWHYAAVLLCCCFALLVREWKGLLSQ